MGLLPKDKMNHMILDLKRGTYSKFLSVYLLLPMLFITCSDQDDKIAILTIQEYPKRQQDFSLWQLEQFYGDSQMGYIIKTDDNHIVVIDGGRPKSARFIEGYLMQLGGVVDTWITTHPHEDHIGALKEIIQGGKITVKRILHSAQDLDLIKLHEPISYELVRDYYLILKSSKIPVLDVKQGEVFSLGAGIDLSILGDRNDKILVNLVNNSSLTFKISSKSKSILFLGDLGIEGGNEILREIDPVELQSDYVQMAHHGQDGVGKDFYRAVRARYALWPTPGWLWENNLDAKGYNSGTWKTLSVRQWMEELKISRNYVSGLEGTIQID
jgi:hypothetical protein